MKTLLLIVIFMSSARGGVEWSHKNVEGQDGGVAADYVFYKTTQPKSGDHIMSVSRIRAVYAYYPSQKHIVVADYSFNGGLGVKIMKAKPADIKALAEGKDVKFEIIREYKLKLDGERGSMTVLKKDKPLTLEQQNDIVNLSCLMTLERWPLKK